MNGGVTNQEDDSSVYLNRIWGVRFWFVANKISVLVQKMRTFIKGLITKCERKMCKM